MKRQLQTKEVTEDRRVKTRSRNSVEQQSKQSIFINLEDLVQKKQKNKNRNNTISNDQKKIYDESQLIDCNIIINLSHSDLQEDEQEEQQKLEAENIVKQETRETRSRRRTQSQQENQRLLSKATTRSQENIQKIQQVEKANLRGKSAKNGQMVPFSSGQQQIIARKLDANEELYSRTIEVLQEYALPAEIPCREREKQQIREYLQSALDRGGSAHSLYISGVPGIGKTACFLEVIRALQQKGQKNRAAQFQFIHLNAMNFSHPEQVYQLLLQKLTGILVPRAQACQLLHDLFTKGNLPKKYCDQFDQYTQDNRVQGVRIVLLDELDYLLTKDQQLLYNLFDWPHHANSHLAVCGIANTMNFPERLKRKISSRIGKHTRIVFNQYDFRQIATIVQSRLQNLEGKEVFERSAIEFTAKKIAFSASDIRKTLNVCRKGVQICARRYAQNKALAAEEEEEGRSLVRVQVSDIQAAYSQLYDRPYHKCLSRLATMHKVLLLSICVEARLRSDKKQAFFIDSYDRAKQMALSIGQRTFPAVSEAKLFLAHLSSLNLLTVKDKVWLRRVNNNNNSGAHRSYKEDEDDNNNNNNNNNKAQRKVGRPAIHNQDEDFTDEEGPKNAKANDQWQQRLDPNKKAYYNIADLQITLNIEIDDVTNALKDDESLEKLRRFFTDERQ